MMLTVRSGLSSTTPGLTSSTSPTMPPTFFYPPGRPPGVLLNSPDTWTTTFPKIQDQDFFSHDGFSSLIFILPQQHVQHLLSHFRPSNTSKPSFTVHNPSLLLRCSGLGGGVDRWTPWTSLVSFVTHLA
jgi:hypothetical protein